MSMYSANQYDSAFNPQRLPNWCEPKHCKQTLCKGGATTFIADNRGHLLPGVKKRGTAWPDFKGTWDLPAGRSADSLRGSKSLAFDPQHSVCKNTTSLQDVGEHTSQLSCPNDGDEQSDGAALSLNAASPSTQTQREEHPYH